MELIDPIPYAIPVFIVSMLAEAILTWYRQRHQYRFKDTVTCLSTSVMSSLVGANSAGLTMIGYVIFYRYFHLIDMYQLSHNLQLYCLAVLVILQDAAYYWFHRFAHRINFLWASHITHHSSQEYNLAVALRQSSIQQFFSWPVYLPLALIGFPPTWLAVVHSFNLIYQYWIHTREVDRFPAWIEAVFNTPSHHRVHHGTNSQYIDKNYGGMFIIWDKLFGTFELEQEEVRYGLTTQLNSYNPIWANLHQYWYLLTTSVRAPNIFQALKLWVVPPDAKLDWAEVEPASANLQDHEAL